jgi:hypothetical protein
LGHEGKNARGLELNEACAVWARNELGVSVETRSWETAEIPENSLDAVTLFQVLPQMEDPLALLKRVHSWLRLGGTGIVEVPNVEHPGSGLFAPLQVPSLYYVNIPALEELGRKVGLQVVQSTLSEDSRNITVVFHKCASIGEYTGKIQGNCARVLHAISGHSRTRGLFSGHPFRNFLKKGVDSLTEKRTLRLNLSPYELLRATFQKFSAKPDNSNMEENGEDE